MTYPDLHIIYWLVEFLIITICNGACSDAGSRYLQTSTGFQCVSFIGFFPGELLAAKVTISRSFTVYRT